MQEEIWHDGDYFFFPEHSESARKRNYELGRIYSLDIYPMHQTLENILEIESGPEISILQDVSGVIFQSQKEIERISNWKYSNEEIERKKTQLDLLKKRFGLTLGYIVKENAKELEETLEEIEGARNNLVLLGPLREKVDKILDYVYSGIEALHKKRLPYTILDYKTKAIKIKKLAKKISFLSRRLDSAQDAENPQQECQDIAKKIDGSTFGKSLSEKCEKLGYYEGLIQLERLRNIASTTNIMEQKSHTVLIDYKGENHILPTLITSMGIPQYSSSLKLQNILLGYCGETTWKERIDSFCRRLTKTKEIEVEYLTKLSTKFRFALMQGIEEVRPAYELIDNFLKSA